MQSSRLEELCIPVLPVTGWSLWSVQAAPRPQLVGWYNACLSLHCLCLKSLLGDYSVKPPAVCALQSPRKQVTRSWCFMLSVFKPVCAE